jgi:hypothetical protein
MTDDLTPAQDRAVRLALTCAELRTQLAHLHAENNTLRTQLAAATALATQWEKRP